MNFVSPIESLFPTLLGVWLRMKIVRFKCFKNWSTLFQNYGKMITRYDICCVKKSVHVDVIDFIKFFTDCKKCVDFFTNKNGSFRGCWSRLDYKVLIFIKRIQFFNHPKVDTSMMISYRVGQIASRISKNQITLFYGTFWACCLACSWIRNILFIPVEPLALE